MALTIRRTHLRVLLALAALAATGPPTTGIAVAHASACARDRRPCISYGLPHRLGAGMVRTYAKIDGVRPVAVGTALTAGALEDLPTEPTDHHHCFDVNGDGKIDEMTECTGGHEHILDLPRTLLTLPGMPLKWTLLNWNPMGHPPPGIYDKPHFDVHFYLQPKAERDAIRPGPCRGVINCDDFATAVKPLPPEYQPADHVNKGLTEVAMGNHLPDPTSGEWHGQPFTRTFIYGDYDARITFLEPMVTRAYLRQIEAGAAPGGCSAVKQPQAWQQPGWYPQQYCVRYERMRREFTISLEDFAQR